MRERHALTDIHVLRSERVNKQKIEFSFVIDLVVKPFYFNSYIYLYIVKMHSARMHSVL